MTRLPTIGETTIQEEGGQLKTISGPAMPPITTLYPSAKESVPFSNCFIATSVGCIQL